MSTPSAAAAIPHPHVHPAHHEELGFWRTYVFSTDHKVIGIQYGLTALCFLLFGFFLMMMMRWQIAYPGQPIPLLGPLLATLLGQRGGQGHHVAGPLQLASARCTGRSWCSSPSCRWRSGAFGNYVVPLQIGAPDMAFPRLNMASY